MIPANDNQTPIEQLYAAQQRPLLAYLNRIVDDRDLAEDLCQETFLKAIRSWAQLNQPGSQVAWIYRIATNTAYDHMRHRQRAPCLPLSDSLPQPSGPPLDAQLHEHELVRHTLAQLPDDYRVALLLFDAGHSMNEIAALLGCSPSAIKMRLVRARARFRQIYQS